MKNKKKTNPKKLVGGGGGGKKKTTIKPTKKFITLNKNVYTKDKNGKVNKIGTKNEKFVFQNNQKLNPKLKKLMELKNPFKNFKKQPKTKNWRVAIYDKSKATIDTTGSLKDKELVNKVASNPNNFNSSNYLSQNRGAKMGFLVSSTMATKDRIKTNQNSDRRVIGDVILPYEKDDYNKKTIIKNNGIRVINTYLQKDIDKLPTNLRDFQNIIRTRLSTDFNSKQLRKPNKFIYLRIGEAWKKVSTYSLFNNSLIDVINNDKINGLGSNEGSDAIKKIVAEGGYDDLVSDTINFSSFRIELGGTYSGGGDKAKALKYWKSVQPKTKDNLCLEGAIRTHLKLNTRVKQMRLDMIEFSDKIKWGEQINLSNVELYEIFYNVNINVYSDLPHNYQSGNVLLHSTANNTNTMDIVLEENHYSLVVGKKFVLENNKHNYTKKEMIELFGVEKVEVIKEKKVKQKKKKLKERLCIFDIETVYDMEDGGFLKAYGISWFMWDKDEPFVYNENIHNEEPYCFYAKGDDCIQEFLHFLMNAEEGFIYKPIGFNNSRFDNFVICEEALNIGMLRNSFFVDGSILYMVINNVRPSWDAVRFLNCSLAKACDNYGTNPKKRKDLIDHYEIQTYYERNGWDGLMKLLDTNYDLVLYNKIDCICLLDLTLKLRASYIEIMDEDIFDSYTLSSMGYKALNKIWKNNDELNVRSAKSYNIDKFWRDSLTAGRTQSFYGAIDLKMPIMMSDVKSLYPSVMISIGENDCPFPNGEARMVVEEENDKLGIYNCDIIHQRTKWVNEDRVKKSFNYIKEKYGYDLEKKYAPCVIPLRTEDKPLEWFYRGEINNINLTSVDIAVLREATGDFDCVKVKWGYVWDDESYDLFTDYLQPLKDGKTHQDELARQRDIIEKENTDFTEKEIKDKMFEKFGEDYNDAMRQGYKNPSNAISGKLLESIHDDICEVFDIKQFVKYERDEGVSSVEICEFGGGFSLITGKKNKENVFNDMRKDQRKPAHLGMFVYSYARRLMYKNMLSKYITLYMDTDSGALPLIEYDRMCNENISNGLIDSGEYGCFEEEVGHFEMCNDCKEMKNRSLDNNDFSEITHFRMMNNMKNGSWCKKCKCVPADRLIAISPKNYFVGNSFNDKKTKRKFKGVRQNDFWLPISYFSNKTDNEILEEHIKDYSEDEKCKERIRKLTQTEIRRFREFKCCKECINKSIKDETDICENCKNVKSIMKKTYSTEMFECMVRGEKIAVFCSMINRIKYKIEDIIEWEYDEKFKNNSTDIETYEMIFADYEGKTQRQPIQMKYNVDSRLSDEYFRKFKSHYTKTKKKYLKKEYTELQKKEEKEDKKIVAEEMNNWCMKHRRFNVNDENRKIANQFKLKQQFLVKII